ncbi:MAG TPA: NAD-dependent deacylase [Syntrophales bacterium]|nr:NAD-dependent deacylase [Syntrophales bacterium]
MGIHELSGKITAAAHMVAKAKNVVVFTGAGVSTESGIPDFRSPGGIWTRFDPEDFTIQKFLSSPETRKKQWQLLLDGGLFANAEPNKAHLAVAELEKMGRLSCVITQNVDNLHQKAGNSPDKVYELHGNMRWLKCMGCDARYPVGGNIIDEYRATKEVPSCERCRGILKPDVVFFGEMLPEHTLRDATAHATRCDLMIVIGSSLVVYPAAYMPMYAKESGSGLVIVNNTPTSFDDAADIVIHHSAGPVMEKMMDEVRRSLKI